MSVKSPETPPSLRVADLAVQRGERVLFAGLSFTLSPGEALLLRGPNGAGKSSLLLALAGIVRAELGTIAGNLPDLLHFIGYQHGLKARLTALENLRFWRALHGATGHAPDEALERVGLGGLGGLETGFFSSGQQRRLSLARLLVSRRPIWLLDEPNAALDAAGETLLTELIDAHLGSGGIAVIATHHDLPLMSTAVRTLTLGGSA